MKTSSLTFPLLALVAACGGANELAETSSSEGAALSTSPGVIDGPEWVRCTTANSGEGFFARVTVSCTLAPNAEAFVKVTDVAVTVRGGSGSETLRLTQSAPTASMVRNASEAPFSAEVATQTDVDSVRALGLGSRNHFTWKSLPGTTPLSPTAPLVVKQPFDLWHLRVSSEFEASLRFADYAPKFDAFEKEGLTFEATVAQVTSTESSVVVLAPASGALAAQYRGPDLKTVQVSIPKPERYRLGASGFVAPAAPSDGGAPVVPQLAVTAVDWIRCEGTPENAGLLRVRCAAFFGETTRHVGLLESVLAVKSGTFEKVGVVDREHPEQVFEHVPVGATPITVHSSTTIGTDRHVVPESQEASAADLTKGITFSRPYDLWEIKLKGSAEKTIVGMNFSFGGTGSEVQGSESLTVPAGADAVISLPVAKVSPSVTGKIVFVAPAPRPADASFSLNQAGSYTISHEGLTLLP